MKPKRLTFTPVTQSATNIAAAQTPAGATALTLAGALTSGGVVPDLGMGYILLLTAVSDESAKTLAVVGFNEDMKAQTETITCPNATTGFSTKFWRAITSITASGAFTGNISVGTANTTLSARSPTYPLNIYNELTRLAMDVSGTINVGTEIAFERVTAGDTPNWVAGGISNGTADANGTAPSGAGAVHLKIASYTNGATVALQVTSIDYART